MNRSRRKGRRGRGKGKEGKMRLEKSKSRGRVEQSRERDKVEMNASLRQEFIEELMSKAPPSILMPSGHESKSAT